MPWEAIKYEYRRMFGLTAEEFEDEPVHEFFTNLMIHDEIEERKRRQRERE